MMRFVFVVLLLIVVLAACNLTTTTPTPVPTPDLPTVEFLEPPNNSKVFEGVDMSLDIVARDPGAGVARVELFVDGELINDARPEDSAAVPVLRAEMNWLAEGPGLHALTAIAYRLDGTRSDEALLTVEVVVREAATEDPGP
jgi:hypothetical protein